MYEIVSLLSVNTLLSFFLFLLLNITFSLCFMLFEFVSCIYVFVILKLIVHISLKVNQILLKCDKVFVLHMQLFSSNQQNPCEPASHIATETLRACLSFFSQDNNGLFRKN